MVVYFEYFHGHFFDIYFGEILRKKIDSKKKVILNKFNYGKIMSFFFNLVIRSLIIGLIWNLEYISQKKNNSFNHESFGPIEIILIIIILNTFLYMFQESFVYFWSIAKGQFILNENINYKIQKIILFNTIILL